MIQTKYYPAGYAVRRPMKLQHVNKARRMSRQLARQAESVLCPCPADERGYRARYLCRTRFGRVLLLGGLYGLVFAAGQLSSGPAWGILMLAAVGAVALGLHL